MKLVGFTLCKNAVKYNYPVEMHIEQHIDLLDQHYFIVPQYNQDNDGTIELINKTFTKFGKQPLLFHVNWPTEQGFYKESIDKILQFEFIKAIESKLDYNDWLIKIDADEFHHENDFDIIKSWMYNAEGTDITQISFNYHQLVGSLEYRIWDPTFITTHMFKNNSGAFFPGNDAMNIRTDGSEVYLDNIYINHIGYVKSAEQLTVKIKEHFVLNESVYDKRISKEQIDKFIFEFPCHKKGVRLWPLGISVLEGYKNEVEYFKMNEIDLPFVFMQNKEHMRFYIPEGV